MSTHHYQSIHQVSRLWLQYFLRYFADKIASIFFQRAITQTRGIILSRKKIRVSYFFMRNPCKKFQIVAFTVLKLCYASKSVTNGRKDGRMDGRTNNPEAICPSNFFEVGGIITILEHDPWFVLLTFQISNYLKVYNQLLPGGVISFVIIQPTIHAKKLVEMVQSFHSTVI